MELGTVRQIDIDQEMQGAYLDYAMSVIVARALPDVRDGFKPVHRRILYAMHDLGLRPDKPYKKSARIVGEVLGKYHPHGDVAVYEAMARMAQDFSLRYMLVDGQGNFGSVDGDSPAAMRYTETRLAFIAEEMLCDIDKDTVNFSPNFDGTLTEPSVMPAALPNLLVNGASGIAVGMTTNIPPHNLGEVCDALVYMIDNYAKLDDVSVEDLTRFIQGPDFPTGGVLYRYAGESDDGDRNDVILNAYAMGRGQLTVQAQVHIEEMSRNRSRIVVTELPYQVNKTRLIERIAELVRDGRLEGITDLRDESDRQGMRITIEMTRTVEPRAIMSQLFKQTPMQVTFGMIMVALVDGEPRLLSLKKVLIHYLDHRQEVITRRTHFLLERAKLRAHILEGLLKALDNIDRVIAIIKGSRTTETARVNLMKELKLTEIQADAILDMPLKRLAALERKKIADEYKEKLDEIKYLTGLLRNPARIRGVIRDDLLALKAKYGDARRTRIVDREKGLHTTRDLVTAEDTYLTLWQDGEVSLSAQPPAVSKLMPVAQQWGNTRDDVAFFAASGLAALAPLHQIPGERSIPVSGVTALDRSETPIGALILPHSAGAEADENGDGAAASFVTLATSGGRIKRVTVEDLASAASKGVVTTINVDKGDQLGWVALTGGQDEIVLVTRQGRAIRFPEDEVRPMGLSAAGVLAIKLGRDDAVVGMGLVGKKGCVVTISELGFAKRTAVAEFTPQKRYGGGIQAAKLSTRTGRVAVAALAGEDQVLALMLAKGQVMTIPVKAVPSMGRATTGQKKRLDTKQDLFDPPTHGLPTILSVLAAAPAPSAKGPSPEVEDKGPAAPRRSRAAKVELEAEEPAPSRTKQATSTLKPPATTPKEAPVVRPEAASVAPPEPEPKTIKATTTLKPAAKTPKEKEPPPSRAKQPAAETFEKEQPPLPGFLAAKQLAATLKPAAKTPKKEQPAPSRAKKTVKGKQPPAPQAKQVAIKPEPLDQPLDLDIPAYLRRKPARPAQEPAQEPPSPWAVKSSLKPAAKTPPDEGPPMRTIKYTRLAEDPGQKKKETPSRSSTKVAPPAKTPKNKPAAKAPQKKKEPASKNKPVATPKPKTLKPKKPASSRAKPAAKEKPDAETLDMDIPAFLIPRISGQTRDPAEQDPPPPSTKSKPARHK